MNEKRILIKEIEKIIKKKKKIIGYNPGFLGIDIPVPYILPDLYKDILHIKKTHNWLPGYLPPVKDGISLRYANFTIVMNKKTRMAIYTALNIDRKKMKIRNKMGVKIRQDPRIGNEFQLNNAYYKNNPWDKGHMTRRHMVQWGDTQSLVDIASKHTLYYTNICPQHSKFNKYEWTNLEAWVQKDMEIIDSNKMTVFTGPIFEKKIFSIHPKNNPLVIIPSAFFKVVYFMDHQDNIKVYAFIMEHNVYSPLVNVNPKDFLVSLDEVEKRTKLRFHQV